MWVNRGEGAHFYVHKSKKIKAIFGKQIENKKNLKFKRNYKGGKSISPKKRQKQKQINSLNRIK